MHMCVYIYVYRYIDISGWHLDDRGGARLLSLLLLRGVVVLHQVPLAPPCIAGSALRLQRAGFRVQGSAFRVQRSGFSVQGSAFRVQRSGFSVQGSAFRVQRSGFSVQG